MRKVEHSNGHVAWRTPQVTIAAGLVQHCSASSWPQADMVVSMISAQMMWATLWGEMVAGTTGTVYNRHAIARHVADEGQPTVTPCQWSGPCQCAKKAPKFQWK